MLSDKSIKINEEDVIAKSSKKDIAVRKDCLKFLDSHRFLDASLDELSVTLTCFPSLDLNAKRRGFFEEEISLSI